MKNRISELRKSLNLTQEEFGNKLGLSRNYIWMMEKGERVPPDRTIADICRVFGIREEWLRDGLEPMRSPKSREEEVAEMVGQALNGDNELKQAVIRMICTRTDEELAVLNKAILAICENL